MKKMSLNAKLKLSGIILALIPLLLGGLISLNKSAETFEQSMRREFALAAENLAVMTEAALSYEIKIAKGLAMLPAIVQAAESVTTKSISDPTFETVQATRVLSDILKQAGSDHEAIILIGSDGAVCSDSANGLHKGINAMDREYFKAAMLGKTSVGTVVKSKSTGDPVVPVCTPVFSDSDKPVGALLIVLKPDFFIHINKNTKIGKNGYAFMADQNGIVIAHPDKKNILRLDMKTFQGMEQIMQKTLNHKAGTETYFFRERRKSRDMLP